MGDGVHAVRRALCGLGIAAAIAEALRGIDDRASVRGVSWRTNAMASAVFAGVALVTSVAQAEAPRPEPVVLRYERGPETDGCPDENELGRAVSARLGYEPFASDAPRAIVVRITRRPRELAGRIELRDARGAVTGTRELVSPSRDCRELVASLSVAIAIGIDPVRGLSGPDAASEAPSPARPEPAPEPERAPQPGPSAEATSPEPSPSPSPSTRLELRGAAGAHVAIGVGPSPALGLTLSAGGRIGRAALALEGRADLPASASVDTGGRVSTSLLFASVVPCVHVGLFAACALGALGSFRAEGEAIMQPLHASKLWGGAGGRLAAELPLGRSAALRGHVDVLAALSPITLQMDGREVWTSPPVSGAFGGALVGSL